jgi:putative ABC transport system permease protein
MSYSLATLWHERQRYLPGVLAVAFSALLIALQCGLLLGLFSITSIPVDRTHADVWIGGPEVLSVDLGRPIPQSYFARLASQPEIESIQHCEFYLQGFAYWNKPNGGSELCMVIGSELENESLGLIDDLKDKRDAQGRRLQDLLTEPGAIIVDESEFDRLGIKGVGDRARIADQPVRVVATLRGLKSLAGPYVFCSIRTARPMLHLRPDQTTYILARCREPKELVKRLNTAYHGGMLAFTRDEFSLRTRMHWLTKTKAGVALGCAALLGLLVGAVVTSQTLYAATAASIREYAVLQALGIPRWRMAGAVLAQSFWVGVFGVCLGIPTAFALSSAAELLYVPVPLPPLLVGGAIAVTLVMALLSGLAALRSLRLVEPAVLLR